MSFLAFLFAQAAPAPSGLSALLSGITTGHVVLGAVAMVGGYLLRHYLGASAPTLPGTPAPDTSDIPDAGTGRFFLDQGARLLIMAERKELGGKSIMIEQAIVNEAKQIGALLDSKGVPKVPTLPGTAPAAPPA